MNVIRGVMTLLVLYLLMPSENCDKSISEMPFEVCLDCLKTPQENKCILPLCPLLSGCNKKLEINHVVINQSDRPKVVCRDHSSLTLKWNQTKDTYYFLEYTKHNSTEAFFTNMTLCGSQTINKLTPNQQYAIQLVSFSSSTQKLTKSQKIMGHTTEVMSERTSVQRLNYTLALEKKVYTATVNWNPGRDLSCLYEIVWYGTSQLGSMKQRKINLKQSIIPEFNLRNLDYGKKYKFAIRSVDENGEKESAQTWLNIFTPSCLDSFKNVSICAPTKPKDLNVTEFFHIANNKKMSNYSLKVSWNEPKFQPNYYNVTLETFIDDQNDHSFTTLNVPGENNSAIFRNIEQGLYYKIKVTATSDGGTSNPAYSGLYYLNRTSEFKNNTDINMDLNRISSFYYWLWCILILLMVLIAVTVLLFRTKIKNAVKRHLYLKQRMDGSIVKYVVSNSEDSKWELKETKLLLNKIVGVGAFGVVQKGWYCLEPNKGTEVAVKMLKARPSNDQISQFYNEMEIMKSVPFHPHIVRLIGVITRNRLNNPLMLVEYCARGDLQSFLRNAWLILGDRFQDQEQSSNVIYSKNYTKVANKFYDVDNLPSIENEHVLQSKDLISFARQIVVGMEFLASLKIVHRDLAARNILLTESSTIKISDFGLSRDIYTNNVYHKVTGGKLPFRWMALESLTHQIYTTESDVWSFGIVLWEIVTLGGNPYPAINTEDLIPLLKQNYRMENPINCNEELYQIMLQCWQAAPSSRPTFTELREVFDKLLESEMQYISLEDAKKLDLNRYENVKDTSLDNNLFNRYITQSNKLI